MKGMERVRILNQGRCPFCGGKQISVTSTRRPVRYWKCLECRATWRSKEFFEIFKDAYVDVDDFNGALTINLLKENDKSQGRMKFEGDIKLIGTGEILINVPAGKLWIINNQTINTQNNLYKVEKEIDEVCFD